MPEPEMQRIGGSFRDPFRVNPGFQALPPDFDRKMPHLGTERASNLTKTI